MSRGINKVILVGNLGSSPEISALPSGCAVTNISIATSESWKDKNTGQQQDRTEWHRVVFFNRLADIAGQYLTKGSKVYVEGSLRTRKWQDKSTGKDRYSTEIVASEMQMLDRRGDAQQQPAHQQPLAPEQQQPAQQRPQLQRPQQSHYAQQSQNVGQSQGDPQWDDDIPF